MSASSTPDAVNATPTPSAKSLRAQRWCALSGFAFLGFFAVGIILAHYIPPPPAHESLIQVQRSFTHGTTRLRLGLTFMLVASAFYLPWSGVISLQLKRLEGEFSVFAYTELASGAVVVVTVMVPLYILLAAAFRPHRDPQITQIFYDLAFIPFIGAFGPVVMENIACAAAIFNSDRRDVYPRWLAWVNVACIPLLLPALTIPFFKTGPFAWQGIFEFWLAAITFFGWCLIMTLTTLAAIRRQASAPEPTA